MIGEDEYLIHAVKCTAEAAFSEVLGNNREILDTYFSIELDNGLVIVSFIDDLDIPAVIIPREKVEDSISDSEYYGILRDLAKDVASSIPEEEKNIPKDKWPEPKVWKDELE